MLMQKKIVYHSRSRKCRTYIPKKITFTVVAKKFGTNHNAVIKTSQLPFCKLYYLELTRVIKLHDLNSHMLQSKY